METIKWFVAPWFETKFKLYFVIKWACLVFKCKLHTFCKVFTFTKIHNELNLNDGNLFWYVSINCLALTVEFIKFSAPKGIFWDFKMHAGLSNPMSKVCTFIHPVVFRLSWCRPQIAVSDYKQAINPVTVGSCVVRTAVKPSTGSMVTCNIINTTLTRTLITLKASTINYRFHNHN